MSQSQSRRIKWVGFIGGAAALVLLMLYMTGFFVPGKIGPGSEPPAGKAAVEPEETAVAERTHITEFYEAVGTVRPVTETRVESLIRARISQVLVRPGDRVNVGTTLVVLDSREPKTQLEQARQALKAARARVSQARQGIRAAEAAYRQAEAHYRRIQTYVESEAATQQDLEQARSGYLQAQAHLDQSSNVLSEARSAEKQAEKQVQAAEIILGYTRIAAEEDGQIVERLAEPGDLAFPGKPLVTLQTPGRLRLEAQVREGLIQRVAVGRRLTCVISALEQDLEAEIQEIVPAADPASRTFLVKASLPSDQQLFPGMFGRLLVPVKERPAVLIPQTALRSVGQLAFVTARLNDGWEDLLVKTGRTIGDRIEILAGLDGGEVLALRGE